MPSRSPFTLNRFELEEKHLYYLPEPIFTILQDRKSVYLIGSRGTGKTTLLQALNCEEQLSNAYLRKQLQTTLSAQRYIGVYLRVPVYQSVTFDRWLAQYGETLSGTLFGLYLDLLWLDALTTSISSLIVGRVFKAPPTSEYALTGEVFNRHPELLAETDAVPQCSIKRLSTVFYKKWRTLQRFAFSSLPLDIDGLARLFPIGQIGDLGRSVAGLLEKFCNDHSPGGGGHGWHFKICLDEAECLTPLQQKVLNTCVRLTKTPVSYVVSYVRPMEEMTATLIPNITLQKADRDILTLDDIDDQAFTALAEGVSLIRIQRVLGRSDIEYSTEAVLGRLDINVLLYGLLQSSENQQARALIEKAREFGRIYEELGLGEGPLQFPPIYQTYIIDRLRLKVPSPDTPRERRAQDSAELRKRMVAAYLCLCSEYNLTPKFAYAEMVLQMSDQCIRDYLSQMHEVFMESGVDLASFCARTVPVEKQDVALRRASVLKREFVPASGVGSPAETVRLVDALAQLTADLQTIRSKHRQYQYKALRSSERGVFVLESSTVTTTRPEVFRLIANAAEAGFLKLLKQSADSWHFRVHCSLAAAYGFSYRGAYYATRIGLSDLWALVQERDPGRRKDLIEEIGRVISGDDADSLPLFEGLSQ